MYLLKALRPDVIDALSNQPFPEEGVKREVLLPPDHYAERTGDISITKLEREQSSEAPAIALDVPTASAVAPALESRGSRAGKASTAASS